MFKQFLPLVLCVSFVASPAIAIDAQNCFTYLESEQFGMDMFHISEGAMFMAFATFMASMTIFTVYGTYKLISEDFLSQKAQEARPRPINDLIDLQVDITLSNN